VAAACLQLASFAAYTDEEPSNIGGLIECIGELRNKTDAQA